MRTLWTLSVSAILLIGMLTGPVLANSAAVPVISRVDFSPLYDRSELRAAVTRRGFPVEIYGGPSADATPDQIAGALRMPAGFQNRALFAIASEDRGTYPTRLVLLFNAPAGFYDTACQMPDRVGARAVDGPLEVAAIVCLGKRFLSAGHLRDTAITGETDPRFGSSMAQLFKDLMPQSNPLRDEGRLGR